METLSATPPPDPYKGYRVQAIEKDRLAKEEQEAKKSIKKNIGLAGLVLLLFRNLIDFFEAKIGKGSSLTKERDAREGLLGLKEAFEILKREDRSQDLEYLRLLSKHWELVLEDALRFTTDSKTALKYKQLIKAIQSYPKGQEHSLGYYLTEHAGQNWLPFPYIDTIRHLHSEHQKNPRDSILEEWIKSIHILLSLFANID